jgi:hypothetical protein
MLRIDAIRQMGVSDKLAVLKSRIFSARYLRGFLMKNGQYSDAPVMGLLNQAKGGLPVSKLCRDRC